MKKDRLVNILTVVTMAVLLFIGYTAFSLRHTDKTILHTGIYTELQINRAMNTVSRYFTVNYPDCKLTRLYTDESGTADTDKLIILADYHVGSIVQLHPSMNTGSTYTRWEFELTNKFGIWFITNQGYC